MRTALRCTLAAGAVLSASGLAVPAPLKPRVVVTGLGTVSGCGIGQEAFWASCVAGTSSVGTVTHFDPEAYQCQIGSEVRDEDQNFVPADYFKSPKSVKSNDRATHFAVAASQLAVEDAGLVVTDANAPRIGVMVGSAFGGMQTFETQCAKLIKSGPKRVSPFTIPALLGNTHAGVIGIEVGAKGPNFSAISACATGSHCLGLALQSLQSGETDVMLAGGCEAAITPLSYAGFGNMKALASTFNDAPTKGSRPFDNDRAGFVMGEGAGVLVLETEAHALARGAEIYCEFVGYGASCDAYHITTPAPGGEGLARAISAAMGMAGLDGAELDYYNAHGTSTAYNDKFETMALKGAIGEENAKNVMISSTKGVTGHTLGAAGGLEAVAIAKAIATGSVPPTINLDTPDPDCDLDYTPNTAKTGQAIKAAASGNLGFGGHNAAIVFKAYE